MNVRTCQRVKQLSVLLGTFCWTFCSETILVYWLIERAEFTECKRCTNVNSSHMQSQFNSFSANNHDVNTGLMRRTATVTSTWNVQLDLVTQESQRGYLFACKTLRYTDNLSPWWVSTRSCCNSAQLSQSTTQLWFYLKISTHTHTHCWIATIVTWFKSVNLLRRSLQLARVTFINNGKVIVVVVLGCCCCCFGSCSG